MKSVSLVAIVTAAALVFALAPLPYGYYTFLRLVVFATGVFCGWQLWQAGEGYRPLALALFGAALLFNPIIPVHLSRGVWAVIDLAVAGIFAFAAHRARHAVP